MSLQIIRTNDETRGPDPMELLLSEVEVGHKLLEAAKRATRPERGLRFFEVACAVAIDLEARLRDVQRAADRQRLRHSLRGLEVHLANDWAERRAAGADT